MAHLPMDFFKDGKQRPLKIGKSFLNNSEVEEYMSVTYDFKPPSSETSQTMMEIGSDNNVSITVRPENSDDTSLYKGSMQEATKDCFLIVDHETGEISLEKVCNIIRVKRTREAGSGGGRHTNTTPQDHGRPNYDGPAVSMPDLQFEDDEEVGEEDHCQEEGGVGGGLPHTAAAAAPVITNGAVSNLSGSSSSSCSSSSSESDSDSNDSSNERLPRQSPHRSVLTDKVLDDLELSSASEDE